MTTIEQETEQNIVGRAWQWIKQHPTQITAAIFWLVILLATRQYMQSNQLSFGDLATQLSELLTGTWYGPLIYIGVYLLRPLILFPASILTLLAGNIFGLALGFLYALIAGTLSSLVPYSVGRWFSSEEEAKEKTLDEDGKESRIQQFMGMLRRNPFQAVLTMRLLFLPYDGVSLIAGAVRIGLVPFFLATAIGNIGGTFAYVGAGASIEGDIATGNISINPYIFGVTIAILIVSLIVSRVLNKLQSDKKKNSETLANASA